MRGNLGNLGFVGFVGDSAFFWGDSAKFAESAGFLGFFVLDSAFFAESALFSAPRRSLSLSLSRCVSLKVSSKV
ncbi:hypothetical protein ACWIUD_08410 [Helicobacter sp. 23-1044]